MSTETPDGSTSVGQSVSHVTLGVNSKNVFNFDDSSQDLVKFRAINPIVVEIFC